MDVAKRLLRANHHVEERDASQQTALHVAMTYNQVEMGQFLLSSGGAIEAKDKNDWTPLHCACYSGTPPSLFPSHSLSLFLNILQAPSRLQTSSSTKARRSLRPPKTATHLSTTSFAKANPKVFPSFLPCRRFCFSSLFSLLLFYCFPRGSV